MSESPLSIVYLTSGAAGMYCGSCLHDNTLARALIQLGCDVRLIPTYTPIRTDEENVSAGRLFFGGINVYLQQKSPLFRYLPRWADRWLDGPRLVERLTFGRIATRGKLLGELTVSMLRGERGNQRKEVSRLVDHLAAHARPDVVILSNVLIGGCAAAIRRRLGVPVLATLQGDDGYLMDLAEPYRAQAVAEIRQIAQSLDGFLVHSEYYGDFMSGLLELPRERLHKVPLGIDTSGFPDRPADRRPDRPPTIGFLARHCPAKGLHVLVDAFLALRRGPGAPAARLRSAGWLGEEDREYFEQQRSKVAAAGLADEFSYAGVVDRAGKIEFLRGLDVLAVPTTYREPKGLFVLEALAAGVPVVLPEHGAFPELIAATGGGVLVPPDDPNRLAQTLGELLADEPRRQALARAGHEAVHRRLDALAMARTTLAVLRKVLSNVRGR